MGLKMADVSKKLGVDALIDQNQCLEKNPYCAHGPTILFERFFKDKPSRKFYACSACRDRKDCAFFQWADEKVTSGKQILQQETKNKLMKKKPPRQILSEGVRKWCFDCNLVLASHTFKQHADHNCKTVTEDETNTPTKLLYPLDNKKVNAQFFFSTLSCQFLVDTIKHQMYKKVVCIGTPKLFEQVMVQLRSDIQAVLLDIDDRFSQFYDTDKYIHYNMFNNFFFDSSCGEETLVSFLRGTAKEDVLLLIDPPFGGLMSLLGMTIKKVWALWNTVNGNSASEEELSTILIFPYFQEPHVMQSIKQLQMCDYKVTYSNHPLYKKTEKKGSPVRLFTNVPLHMLKLPKEEGYRFCKECQKYISKENRHCTNCNACTSKDGRTYVHCALCKKCVKPGRQHCAECNTCELPEHTCHKDSIKIGCHICGHESHKRKDCPNKNDISFKRVKQSVSLKQKHGRVAKENLKRKHNQVSTASNESHHVQTSKKKKKKKKLLI